MSARLDELVAGVLRGERAAVARALNLVDDRRPATAEERLALLERLLEASPGTSRTLGITGPPGVGKSTLTARLIQAYRAAGHRVGVLAVDPSSRRSGGALLGDRIRFQLPPDDGVFVRSLATRGRLGGLSEVAYAAKVVLAAGFDRVILETVGVGQTETEVADAVDAVLLVLQPASGDAIQFLKAGIMEIPDILVLNKCDLAATAATLGELRAALRALGERPPRLVRTTARTGAGTDELLAAIEAFLTERTRSGDLERRRTQQWRRWLLDALAVEAGRRAVAACGGEPAIDRLLAVDGNPFRTLTGLLRRLRIEVLAP